MISTYISCFLWAQGVALVRHCGGVRYEAHLCWWWRSGQGDNGQIILLLDHTGSRQPHSSAKDWANPSGQHISLNPRVNSMIEPGRCRAYIPHRAIQIKQPSQHDTLARCWFRVGPLSATLASHLPNIRSVYRVFWENIFGAIFWILVCNRRSFPANMKRWTTVDLMLAPRLPTLVQRLVFYGLILSSLNLTLSSSSTTSHELLSQFPTCSGWRWLEVLGKWHK